MFRSLSSGNTDADFRTNFGYIQDNCHFFFISVMCVCGVFIEISEEVANGISNISTSNDRYN